MFAPPTQYGRQQLFALAVAWDAPWLQRLEHFRHDTGRAAKRLFKQPQSNAGCYSPIAVWTE